MHKLVHSCKSHFLSSYVGLRKQTVTFGTFCRASRWTEDVYKILHQIKLECGPMPNVMAALPNIGGAHCSTPQSLADAYY